ncbi:Lar family restriction alleviation protein [Fimbriiglobus ruber]|uniref:Lar family restriction alleviation protein n=1 Tax=Fimbriiglobus ruber TaxID=1908690 RepID=UPI000B4AECA5
MTTDLKPCPFCGGAGIVDPHDNDTWCMIKCVDCGATTNSFSAIVDATHYWNTRTPKAAQQPVGLAEKLRAISEHAASYCGCRCSIDDCDPGNCWPCRMMSLSEDIEEVIASLPKREAVKEYDPHLPGGCPIYSEAECHQMRAAYETACQNGAGYTETLFAPVTAVLRMRGHLPEFTKPNEADEQGRRG